MALKIYGLLLLLGLLYAVLALSDCPMPALLKCQGEFCFMGPLVVVLGYPAAILYWLAPHFYWDVEGSFLNILACAFGLWLCYRLGDLVARLLQRKS